MILLRPVFAFVVVYTAALGLLLSLAFSAIPYLAEEFDLSVAPAEAGLLINLAAFGLALDLAMRRAVRAPLDARVSPWVRLREHKRGKAALFALLALATASIDRFAFRIAQIRWGEPGADVSDARFAVLIAVYAVLAWTFFPLKK
ncbi:MAG: hypothetical protein AAF763_00845 [Pseudomonadota bacterium]